MSRNLKKFADCIIRLHEASPRLKKNILADVIKKDCFIKCICECSNNLLHGVVPLTEAQKKKLSKKKKTLRLLSSQKTSLKKKRKLIQSGGFLGALLGPIVSVLGSLFGGGGSS